MNNVKIVYYNIETIDSDTFETMISSNQNTLSHYNVKPGLILVNYKGSAQALYESLGEVIKEKSILILDLSKEERAYYGFMNKDLWKWIEINNKKNE